MTLGTVDLGVFAFGLVIGWFTYFVNRYRQNVALGNVATIIGALGGAAVLALFPEQTTLFSSYGIGFGVGFFGYFLVLLFMVRKAGWSVAWFLDGRRPALDEGDIDGSPGNRPMVEVRKPSDS